MLPDLRCSEDWFEVGGRRCRIRAFRALESSGKVNSGGRPLSAVVDCERDLCALVKAAARVGADFEPLKKLQRRLLFGCSNEGLDEKGSSARDLLKPVL